ncbi:MAG: glycosyltransferase, partial [Brasilonema sp.]
MNRFLFCTYGASGHINPTLPVAIALKQCGHEVAILTSTKYADTVRNSGLTYIAPRTWEATLEKVEPEPPTRNPFEMFSRVLATVRTVFLHDSPLQAHDLRAAMRDWSADVLVGSNATGGVSLVAEQERIPWATHSLTIACMLPSRDLPRFGMGAVRPHTPIQLFQTRLLNRLVDSLMSPLSHEWNTLRAKERLPRRNVSLLQNLISPYLYTIPSSTAFDFPRSDLPPQVHYVGPCLWKEGKGVMVWENPFQDDKPLVY